MLKRAVLILGILVALGVIALVFVTRNTPATHPVLAASTLPPLIPTRAFFADPRAEFGFVASSDGAYTVSEKASILGRSKVVREVATGNQIAELPVGIGGIRWHPTEPRIRFIFEGHDWEVDLFNPARENWARTSPVALSGGWVLNQFATDPDMPVMFWGRTSARGVGHMWHVSQDGLEATRVAEGTASIPT